MFFNNIITTALKIIIQNSVITRYPNCLVCVNSFLYTHPFGAVITIFQSCNVCYILQPINIVLFCCVIFLAAVLIPKHGTTILFYQKQKICLFGFYFTF